MSNKLFVFKFQDTTDEHCMFVIHSSKEEAEKQVRATTSLHIKYVGFKKLSEVNLQGFTFGSIISF